MCVSDCSFCGLKILSVTERHKLVCLLVQLTKGNKQHLRKVLLNQTNIFHMKGHTIAFPSQSQKLHPHESDTLSSPKKSSTDIRSFRRNAKKKSSP